MEFPSCLFCWFLPRWILISSIMRPPPPVSPSPWGGCTRGCLTLTHTPVSTGLKNPWRICLSGNWTLRTTWRHEAQQMIGSTGRADNSGFPLTGLTWGYLSIFSLICASLKDLVISGASSKNFLHKLGKQRENTVVRSRPPRREEVTRVKRRANTSSRLMCGRGRVTV